MEKYLEEFVCNLQEAAEAAGKDFDPATRTELEIEQLYALYEAEGKPMEEFVREHMREGYHA